MTKEHSPQQVQPWFWELGTSTSEISEADDEEIPAKDFRAKEAEQIFALLSSGHTLVFVRANSGFGVSGFLIPKLGDMISQTGKTMFHTEGLDLSYLDFAEELGDIFVIDEIGQSQGRSWLSVQSYR